MTRTYLRFILFAVIGSGLLPIVTSVAARLHAGQAPSIPLVLLAACLVALVTIRFRHILPKLEPVLDAEGRAQAEFTDRLPDRWVSVAIAGAAGLSLFLELAVIRWQGTVFPLFAFYTNFGLLACFAGLGLGYALAARDRLPLTLVIPLIAWQMLLLVGLQAGLEHWHLEFLGAMPVVEQFSMGLRNARTLWQGFAIYYFLAVVFVLTALAFIPVGQLCGRLMTRQVHLRAYGLNLVGSLAGVLLMFAASALWTPPPVWYTIIFAGLLLLSARRPGTMGVGALASVVAIVTLSWPASSWSQRVYSPYQMLELGYSDKGLMQIRAAGHYYQRVHDFSGPPEHTTGRTKWIRDYYDLAYRVLPAPADVAIVGAGAGNDVAAALRGGAQHVHAIEIDPAILRAGQLHHPEHPYRDERVTTVVNDARSFLRNTDRSFDLIVYGLLDSHTLLSASSSVRLDSFVYTVDAFREARQRLKPGGHLVLSFAVMSTSIGRKMKEMLTEAFDGVEPVVISAIYDAAVVFIQSREADFALPPGALDGTRFELTTRFDDPSMQVDVSTDDWPFFYMPRRVYPVSYLALLGMILALSLTLTVSFVGERPRASEASFFLLGAGFMLVETKAITEMGLTFGSTWHVIGIVIAGILLMAFLANAAVQRFRIQRPQFAFIALLATLATGWVVMGGGGFPSTTWGRIATVVLLTSPMFFSGIVFSTLLGSRGAIAAVMAANLAGAMLGGLLEYNAMYFGFRFLYLLAMGFYGLAFLHWALSRKTAPAVAPREADAGVRRSWPTPTSPSAVT